MSHSTQQILDHVMSSILNDINRHRIASMISTVICRSFDICSYVQYMSCLWWHIRVECSLLLVSCDTSSMIITRENERLISMSRKMSRSVHETSRSSLITTNVYAVDNDAVILLIFNVMWQCSIFCNNSCISLDFDVDIVDWNNESLVRMAILVFQRAFTVEVEVCRRSSFTGHCTI
jgi:hypothetical protein